jgi:uncharacterized protein YndB with AHSA1/START domain
MMPATICKEITIQAPAAHIWPLVGTEAGLRQWWQMDVTLEAKPGGHFVERGVVNGAPYHLEGTVAVYDPPRQLVLLLAGVPLDESWPTAMNITITLEDRKDATVVRVVHQLYGTAPATPARPQVEPSYSPIPYQLPAILNQLPGRAEREQAGDALAPTAASPALVWVDQEQIRVYETRWTARLFELSQQVTAKGTDS